VVRHENAQLLFVAALVPFIILATLNSGGYRYGASDQAFYVPATLLQLDPELFPRDRAVLSAQTRLTLVDEIIAGVVRLTGASLPTVFVTLYVAALALLAWSLWHIGGRLYRERWTTIALLAAFTLRHAIARSGTNTLEGYWHPRVLAFALGVTAILFFLRRGVAVPLALVTAALLVHPTTGLWFMAWLTVATAIGHAELRRYLGGAAVVGVVLGTWMLIAGPLAGRLRLMDPEWRQLLATKNYLFPLGWPIYAWVINLGYLPVIAWIYRRRRRLEQVDGLERALVLGSTSLAVIFAGALVMQAVGVSLAIQLQPARIFWMFDLLATVYAVWFLAEGWGPPAPARIGRRSLQLALVLLSLSLIRGVYGIAGAERPVYAFSVPDDDWGRVMAYARNTDKRSGWLADPLHAVLYGTSVRVAGERDVFVEAVKDAALGMYDRDIAVRTARRVDTIGDFDTLSAADARRLAADYDLDYVVTEQHLDLPLAFESGRLNVYRLR
jgi:hypothetical protein